MNEGKRVTLTAVSVLFGLGMLKSLLVDGGLPSRRRLLGLATVAAMLSVMADLKPELAKYFGYLIITGATLESTIPITDALAQAREATGPPAGTAPGDPGAPPRRVGGTTTAAFTSTDAAAADRMAALPPVFLRGSGAAPARGTVARRQNRRHRIVTSTA